MFSEQQGVIPRRFAVETTVPAVVSFDVSAVEVGSKPVHPIVNCLDPARIAGPDIPGAAEKARDYLMSLPERFKKISDRGLKAPVEFQFSWIKY